MRRTFLHYALVEVIMECHGQFWYLQSEKKALAAENSKTKGTILKFKSILNSLKKHIFNHFLLTKMLRYNLITIFRE